MSFRRIVTRESVLVGLCVGEFRWFYWCVLMVGILLVFMCFSEFAYKYV